MKKRIILMADAMSFYASCEKARHPEYKDQPLVVGGDVTKRSGIILAACPIAKKFGVTTAEPLWKALQKCPNLIVMRPSMEYYIKISLQITEIAEKFSDLVENYSIDEFHCDVTSSLSIFGTPYEIAQRLQSEVLMSTGVYLRCCISENKVLSKIGLDIIAKKIEGGIFEYKREDLREWIWPKPVEDMWMVGSKMHRHLNKMGIYTIGELANTPLTRLTRRWGVNGNVLWRIANGHDDSKVTPDSFGGQKVIGNGMVLPIDYGVNGGWDIEVVLGELCTQVGRRARKKYLMGQVISVGCQGADWDHPTGFHRQMKLTEPTSITKEMYNYVKQLFHKHWDGQPVRRLSVSLSGLTSDSVVQLSLFDDRDKLLRIERTLDQIKDRFGETAILRASSKTTAGLAIDRAMKIGGHYK